MNADSDALNLGDGFYEVHINDLATKMLYLVAS